MQLFEQYTRAERAKMVRTGVRFVPIGRYQELPESVVREFEKTKEATAGNSDITLNLAVNYGGRDEILEASRRIAVEVQAGRLQVGDIDEALFSSYVYTAGQADPDLLIRTSGELRISNFLLWQSAYTEFYFTDLYWPEVDRQFLLQAFAEYEKRDRRQGA
jgi:undecaprenyl diphosphate synthase